MYLLIYTVLILRQLYNDVEEYLVHKSLFYNTTISLLNALVCFLTRIKLIAYLFCIRYPSKKRIVQIFVQIQKFWWVDLTISSSAILTPAKHTLEAFFQHGGQTRSVRKSGTLLPLSETFVHYFLCGNCRKRRELVVGVGENHACFYTS